MGFNPMRPSKRSPADYVMVAAALVIVAFLVAWAFLRVSDGTWIEQDDLGTVEVRRVQPYQATKAYACPGCNREIPVGTGHLVAVPTEAPDLRRHWHRSCWEARHRRRPGRR